MKKIQSFIIFFITFIATLNPCLAIEADRLIVYPHLAKEALIEEINKANSTLDLSLYQI